MLMDVVLLLAVSFPGESSGQPPTRDEPHAVVSWLQSFDAAFNAKDLERLAAFYHPDVTIFEGGSTNAGWLDYRDNHIGPELREFGNLRYSHADVQVRPLDPEWRSAYVTSEYRLKARIKEREIDSSGLETLILVRGDGGAWKIRHSHSSARRRP